MSYKTITTFFPTPERVTPLIDAVLPIVRANDAHHVGLHIIPRTATIYSGYPGVDYQVPVEVIERQEEKFRKRASATETVFREHSGQSKISSEWRCVQSVYGALADDISDHSICSDLVVIGLEVEQDNKSWTELPASIAIQTGRPVLAIPNPAKIKPIGKRVMVAWNDTREAARAAFDAIPLILSAESVTVLAIEPETDTGRPKIASGEEIALALVRHAIKAEANTVDHPKRSVGKEIVARVEDDECDLLVMGCYGHSRFRESLLGGATRRLLKRMPVPVLFSH